MKSLKVIPITLICIALIGCNTKSKMKYDKQEILDIEQLRVDALLKNDIKTLTEIMHPKAVHISSNGNRTTTEQWLNGRKNAKNQFATFTLNDDQTIRFYNNIAIIDGSYTNSKRIKDSISPLKNARYTRMYKKQNDTWKMISHQATEVINNKK